MQNVLDQPQLWDTVLGVIASASGFTLLALSLFRKKGVDILLLAFGATSFLYGLRILIVTQLNMFISEEPPRILLYIIAFITYIIPFTLSAFLYNLFGRGWKDSFLWVLKVSVLFSVTGIVSDLFLSEPFSLSVVNNILVILWAVLMFSNIFGSRIKTDSELRIVMIGFLVFGVFALNENLVDLGIVPWQWRNESIGFLVFLTTLGYAAANKFFRNEKQLYFIQQEMETARMIQSSIIPRELPLIENLNLAAIYVPMRAVAGDFYGIEQNSNRQTGILIADVSGHGVGAALIASMIKVAFSSQSQHISDPAYVLSAMNRILHGNIGSNFATAACLFIDTDNEIIHYSGAGHPPGFLWRKSEQKMQEFCENGLMMGPFHDAEYSNIKLPFRTGDRILLYTDGVIEAENKSGEFYGYDSLKNFIKTHENDSAQSFADLLLSDIYAWTAKLNSKSMDDDLTVIVIDKT